MILVLKSENYCLLNLEKSDNYDLFKKCIVDTEKDKNGSDVLNWS